MLTAPRTTAPARSGTAAPHPPARRRTGTRQRYWLPALLVLAALVALSHPASRIDQPSGPIILAAGWQFALDPDDKGLAAGWQRPEASFPAQRTARTGESLADQGMPEYRGYAWFRQQLTVPASWSRVLLGFGAVDVAAQLYVDGQPAGDFQDSTLGSKAALVDLTGRVTPGRPFTLVFRVRGEGGFGGIKQEVRLGQDESQVMTGQQYGLWLHDQHPDWRLLPWMSGGRRAWTVVGQQGADSRAIVASDGSFSPWAGSFSVTPWLYDQTAQRLVDFPPPTASLVDGDLPLPVLTFTSGPWQLREELLPAGSPDHPGVEARITLEAAPGPAWLYLAGRPYTASGGLAPIQHASVAGGLLEIDGKPALLVPGSSGPASDPPRASQDIADSSQASGPPGGSPGAAGASAQAQVEGGVLAQGDASSVASAGNLPSPATATSPQGMAQAVLRVPIQPNDALIVLAPGGPAEPIPAAVDAQAVAGGWRSDVSRVQLQLPDQRLQDAFYASLSYILALQRRGHIQPGPLLHDAFWVRDAAMIGFALERAGLAEEARGSAEAVLAAIAPDGRVAAITNPDGTPRADVEWDAPGEAAFALAEFARASGDEAFLRRAYPRMLAALRTALNARGSDGLLPPNESAEDLGSASQQHYWDDFWLLTGLREAAGAAAQLGNTADAQDMNGAFDRLQASLKASIAASGSDVIPNGPEDLASSAMARGSTPALWPLQVLDPADPLVQRSFETYAQRFMPDGAFRHLYGQWWPYGGLEVAHALLFEGDRDRVNQTLAYTLDHQTFPGLYAWAEGADPATSDFAEGDMPHAWASAELVNLVRDMLLYEDGDRLIVGAGVPSSWQGKPFALKGVPTRWGKADLSVSADGAVTLTAVTPPAGTVLRLPFPAHTP